MSTAIASADRVLGVVPEEQVLVGAGARAWSRGFPAEAVVFPACVEETQALARVANETGTPLLPAGSGSWLGAGGWTLPGDPAGSDGRSGENGGGGAGEGRTRRCPVILSTARMNAVGHYEPADLTLTAGAGLDWAELAGVLRPNGQWLPVDAPGAAAGTLGGVVACGVSGPLQSSYGAARDNVLGLEVVTGDGRVLRVGGRVVKNVAGYDLVRLLTGSRGSLGVITSVAARLFPRPESDVTLLFGGRVTEVVAMARRVCTSPLPVAAVEVGNGPGQVAGGEMILTVRVLGGPGEAEVVCERLAVCAGASPREVLRGGDSEVFHEARGDWEAGSGVVARLAALPDRLEGVLGRVRAAASAMDGTILADAIRGVVRVKGSPAPRVQDRLAGILTRTRREMEEAGGTMTLSCAPEGLAGRVGWTGAAGAPGGNGGLGERIKDLFDPNAILSSRCP